MNTLLIYPPFADPTQPYLGLPTLKGHLRARGLDARVVDLNVEAAHYLLRRETIEDLASRLGNRFQTLNRSRHLEGAEQLEYRALLTARTGVEAVLAADPTPLEVFCRGDLFYDAAAYAMARRHVELYFDAINAVHFPYRFDFNRAGRGFLPSWSFDSLEAYSRDRQSPNDAFYRQVFESPKDWEALESGDLRIDLNEVGFVGVSIVFPSQIPEAFYLCRLLKEAAPHLFVALGGPCIHQCAVHMDTDRRQRLLGWADAIGLYEGEETLAALLPRLPELRGAEAAERARILADIPNLLYSDPNGGVPRQGPPNVVDLRQSAAPDYSDLDLDRYLAPSRTLLYAPTRGCYWNQCSFCYYGLSDTATARYREVPAERAASDIAKLSRRHGVKNFYISCDVLSPSYALRFAQALIDQGVKIRWSSDLKIDGYFTPERCEILYQSGLRAAAFGIESGCDRILELMRKGCDSATMTEVNRSFHRAGIATEWMTFTDHPGESAAEALATVRWMQAEEELIDIFIVGKFSLQPGSHIAVEPRGYGVANIHRAEGDDFGLYVLYSSAAPALTPTEEEQVDREIEKLAAGYALSHYPWAGAISTHHTFLHFLRFSQRAFRHHFQKAGQALHGALPTPRPSHIPGLKEKPRFSLRRLESAERKVLEQLADRAAARQVAGRRGDSEQPVPRWTETAYHEASASLRPLSPGA